MTHEELSDEVDGVEIDVEDTLEGVDFGIAWGAASITVFEANARGVHVRFEIRSTV